MSEYALKLYYIKYLKEIRKVSDSTVRHYQEALRYISRFLEQREMIKSSIYEIRDIDELEIIKEYLYSEPQFIELNQRGHQMYSAGFNNYFKFASGADFSDISQEMELLDTEIPVGEKHMATAETWKRSDIIKIQAIKSSGYKCEINPQHETFISAASQQPYMEGHHALPMKLQDRFRSSLDVYANVVCLCPICHRLLHHGIKSEKQMAIDKIYHDRSQRLAVSGIKLSREEFVRLVV